MRIVVALLACWVAGCADARSLDFRVSLDDELTPDRVAAVVVSIRRGTCDDGDAIYTAMIAKGGSGEIPLPPELSPGSYAFEAIAFDESCSPIGTGCVEITLPNEDGVNVAIAPSDGAPMCAAAMCVDGLCTGASDGGTDSPRDVPTDRAADRGDADAPDCSPEQCNYMDDDCDGRTDEDFELDEDPQHCGACETACRDDHAAVGCVFGVCTVSACDPGYDDCDEDGRNGCETDITSAEHCGLCERRCLSTAPLCETNRCLVACTTGLLACGTDCVTSGTDPDHCAGCGMPCPERDHAFRTCTIGVCGFTCSPGYGDCNDMAGDGCEERLTRSGIDIDGDGFGSSITVSEACDVPMGYVANTDDCDDNVSAVAPGVAESCNGRDDDCDGHVDEELTTLMRTIPIAADGTGVPDVAIDADLGAVVAYVSVDEAAVLVPVDRTSFTLATPTPFPIEATDVRLAGSFGALGLAIAEAGDLHVGAAATAETLVHTEPPGSTDLDVVYFEVMPTASGFSAVYGEESQAYRADFTVGGGIGNDGRVSFGRTISALAIAPFAGEDFAFLADTGRGLVAGLVQTDGRRESIFVTTDVEVPAPTSDRALFLEPLGELWAAVFGVTIDGSPRTRAVLLRIDPSAVRRIEDRDLVLGHSPDAVAGSGVDIAVVANDTFQRFDDDGTAIPPSLAATSAGGTLAYDPGDGRYYHAYRVGPMVQLAVYGCR